MLPRSKTRTRPYKELESRSKPRQGDSASGRLKASQGLKAGKRATSETQDGASERAIRDECDDIVRQIIEIRDRKCFTCDVPRAHYKNIFPGHYVTRKVLALRWSTVNVHAQCNVCNEEHNTNRGRYQARIIRHYDKDALDLLDRIGKENPLIDYVQLLEIRDGLRAELAARKANHE